MHGNDRHGPGGRCRGGFAGHHGPAYRVRYASWLTMSKGPFCWFQKRGRIIVLMGVVISGFALIPAVRPNLDEFDEFDEFNEHDRIGPQLAPGTMFALLVGILEFESQQECTFLLISVAESVRT